MARRETYWPGFAVEAAAEWRAKCQDTAAGPRSRFEDDHTLTGSDQSIRGAEAGHAGANDDDREGCSSWIGLPGLKTRPTC